MTTWTSTSSGSPDADDGDTALDIIDTANAEIAARNAAIQEGGPAPEALWPKANGAQIKSSVEAIVTKWTNDLWVGAKQRLQQSQSDFTAAELQEMRANVTRRRRAGEPKATIIADTAA